MNMKSKIMPSDYDIYVRPEIFKTRTAGRQSLISRTAKSAFDRTMAALALLFFAPLFLVLAAVIVATDGRPIFFRHKRIGFNGRNFGCLKFRTMVRDADEQLKRLLETDAEASAEWAATQKLTNDPRINCVGEFFRKTSLDELPQLWNVVKGEMSIVGPRPIVTAEARHYGSNFEDYLSVRPGITGLWQVSGRSNTTYAERVSLDVEYVSKRSFWLDLKIILKTVKVIFMKEGAR
jgi:exopolysaccharide production protein ExoY